MNNKKIEDMLCEALKKDRIAEFEKQAEQGNQLAQMLLGDIYFYGIDTNDEYWQNLDRAIALTKYSNKMNISNYAFICSCNKAANYDEALKWYKMASQSGNADAEKKILEIQDKEQTDTKNSLMQIFNCD